MSKAQDKKMQELAIAVAESGMTTDELLREIKAVRSGIFSAVQTHDKYGLQIVLTGRTHKPYSMSVNKARTAMILADDIAEFVAENDKPETQLRKAS